eukprot:scaffold154603_cov22-Tisochrysis_lutea.AAC.1
MALDHACALNLAHALDHACALDLAHALDHAHALCMATIYTYNYALMVMHGMQAKVAVLEAAAAHQQSNASSSLAQDPQDRNTHTAITISDSAAGAALHVLKVTCAQGQ